MAKGPFTPSKTGFLLSLVHLVASGDCGVLSLSSEIYITFSTSVRDFGVYFDRDMS